MIECCLIEQAKKVATPSSSLQNNFSSQNEIESDIVVDENENNDRKEIKSSLILQNGTRNNLMQEKNIGGFSEVVTSKLS